MALIMEYHRDSRGADGMSAPVYLDDEAFDALVHALEALTNSDRAEAIGCWEIRLTLGGHGLLPVSVAGSGELEDGLVASLRSICAPRPASLQAA